jgi:hypothetical protein
MGGIRVWCHEHGTHPRDCFNLHYPDAHGNIVQRHARQEVTACLDMLTLALGKPYLNYDHINDAAELLKTAAWRLKPE